MWLEEMLPQDNLMAYKVLAKRTDLPLCLSERLMTRYEAKKIAMMTETYYLPVAPHSCGGPVLHFATAHLAANLTNLNIMESVRRHYLEEYQGILTRNLLVVNGVAPLPPGPGLGMELDSGVLAKPGVTVDRAPLSSTLRKY
jgi:galactonate dehydratase